MGRGGLGADYVQAEGIDGAGTNNANFATLPDGIRPRMQMFLWASKREVLITQPIENQMELIAEESAFSTNNKLINTGEVEGFVVLADDTLACTPLTNAGAIAGNIALIYRGSCNFTVKVKNAQDSGAIAVIVINNAPGAPIPMGGSDNSITIPSIMISNLNGAFVRSLINQNVRISMRDRAPDGNYDNGIIVHEYGHGVSNRLIGGPSNTSCLQNEEQMGEGWSDYLALMLTTDWATASETTARGIGTYALNQDPEDIGIRTYKYSTDLNINPFTYEDVASTPLIVTATGSFRSPHFIGSIWATMLWDLTWKLIESEGIDADIYHGSGGNNIALQLVMDGMKLIKCSPGFVDGRDAILLADELRYNGIHKCAIWEAFARRGLGYSASQGSSNVFNDGTEAFDLPQEEVVSDMAVVEVDELTELVITKTIKNGCEVTNNFRFEDQIPEGTELVEVYSGIPLPGKKVGSPTQNLQVLQEMQIAYKVLISPCISSGNALIETAEGSSVFTSVNLLTGSRNWVKSSSHFNSPGMSWFAQNPNVTSDYTLTQSVNVLLPETAILSFWHKFDTEATWDGGVVEISVNNGPWSDLGEYAIENGYPSNFSSNGSSNLAGRPGFTGDSELLFGSSDFIKTSFDLSEFGGQNIKIRFRFASDDNTDGGSGLNGWYIDDISLDDASVIATTSFNSGIPNLQANTSFVQVIPFDQDIAFVDQESNGNGSGKNWQDANNELETMLQLAGCRNVDSIYLAEGIYIPSESRDSSFVIPDGTSLIGGFQNGGLSRNFVSFPSILSGEIGSTETGDNAYHVVKNMATIHTNKLDGIFIKNGNANGGGLESMGAGILNQGNLILQDVILENNTGGSALHNHNSGHIEFRGNTSVKQ
ncbi:MAG: M36 family metallopeptidase [Saprospiraceae bacterium]|nr:M36 family metallopeptidase [Saprospiraceae bacterium]